MGENGLLGLLKLTQIIPMNILRTVCTCTGHVTNVSIIYNTCVTCPLDKTNEWGQHFIQVMMYAQNRCKNSHIVVWWYSSAWYTLWLKRYTDDTSNFENLFLNFHQHIIGHLPDRERVPPVALVKASFSQQHVLEDGHWFIAEHFQNCLCHQ